MSWQDRLVNASFRGVTFLTESHETRLGRRLAVHEFPGAELPLIEDLGGKATEVRLNAYFIGPDYDLARNALLLELQKPGAAWLVHPWLGKIEVRARDWSLGESNDKNGFCTIGIDFIPAGVAVSQAKIDAVDSATDKLSGMADAIQSGLHLAAMGSDAVNSFIRTVSGQLDHLRTVLAVATLPLTWSQQVTSLIQGIKTDFLAVLELPDDYVSALRSLYTVIGGADADPDAVVPPLTNNAVLMLPDDYRLRVITQLCRLAVSRPINPGLLETVPSSLVLLANLDKNELINAVFIIDAAGQLALADYANAETRDAVLEQLLSAIDAILPVLPDAVFQEAVAARLALITALMARDLDYTTTRTIYNAMPAIVLAHRYELDEPIFNAVNAVRHPLFVEGVIRG